ncbi:diaminopimelate decarboxylase, partial [candidate division KSB1 bacterium]|nr:diaminopimelate decarboxylase [candidate division KSB1 bacterium]
MTGFHYKNGELYCEDVGIKEIAEEYGTPVYLYSKNAIIEKFSKYEKAFAKVQHNICYALKANSNMEILKLLASLGSGADIVSGGELYLALKAGFDPKKIVYASVGKTDDEIKSAIENGICAFNVESTQELEVVNDIAKKMGKQAPVAIRVNPDIDVHGHPYISTGKSINKFGIDIDSSGDLFLKAKEMKGIKIVGVHCHIGSQILNVEYFAATAKKLYSFVEMLQKNDIEIEHIDIGGGLGVNYKSLLPEIAEEEQAIAEPADLAGKVLSILSPLGCELFFEPGRSIIGEAGALVTTVLYSKTMKGKKFVVVDAGMNDLIRPSL